ncbi:MAG: hypothetical protein CBB87_05760 [Micavibrio sp. TMED27]|nr:hypothetical protein [Micavibrio sp.]OUT91523.1 MAG: hypothetical protein CBB87_05760 [Micavibrio sp. TMED27]|tara:strand:- start:5504 stop:7453 length:1950 start_codon:yes stop_codon:yes gene_type:complete
MKTFDTTVNGLRAIAILLVMAFHYGLVPFSGGFVGVDVFFVISGYVITLSVLERLRTKSFSILGYLKSRFFRIFPALLFVSFFTVIASAFILFPSDAYRSAWHALSSISFVSNFVFWKEIGYFDVDNEFKPFLHTWSLSVEWQFYLLWPIAIFILMLLKRFSIPLLVLGIIVSVIASTLLSKYSNFVFYMMPLRGWEFALGALIAFVPSDNGIRKGWPILSVLGVLGVFAASLIYDENTTFPSYTAALPCVSAFLILFFNRRYIEPFFSLTIFQYLGNISYSLYLYHWPVWVLYKNAVYRDLGLSDFGLILVIVFLLSHLSYKYIEQPYRARKPESAKRLSFVLVCVVLLCCGVSYYIIKTDGKTGRYDKSEIALIDYFKNKNEAYQEKYGVFYPLTPDEKWSADKHLNIPCLYDDYVLKSGDDPKIVDRVFYNNSLHEDKHGSYLVIGDSNGKNVYEALLLAFPDKGFSLLMNSGCAAVEAQNCFPHLKEQLQLLFSKADINGVILSSRYSYQSIEGVDTIVQYLREINMPFLITGATPMLRRTIDMVMLHKGVGLGEKFILPLTGTYYHPDIFEKDLVLEKVSQNYEGYFWDKKAVLCPDNQCVLMDEEEGSPLYLDTQHLSDVGIEKLVENMRNSNAFKRFFGSQN